VLCDFGRSRIIDQSGFTTRFAGAVRYMAPELITGELITGDSDDSDYPKVTQATDIYSFAIVGAEVSILIAWIECFPNLTTDSYWSTGIHWIRLQYME